MEESIQKKNKTEQLLNITTYLCEDSSVKVPILEPLCDGDVMGPLPLTLDLEL